MSSLLRRIQRKRQRINGTWEGKPAAFNYRRDGSYDVLRPTKGWLHVSAARLRAQRRLADMVERANRAA